MEATRLLFSHLGLFSALILTVWLPGNILTGYLEYYVFGKEDIWRSLRVTIWIEAIFGPLYTAAIIFALERLRRAERVSYVEAMSAAFRRWPRLFVARMVAGVLVLLGFVALVIPGVLLLVRYALLDPVVVLEDVSSWESRSRSAQLTRGRRWPIFGAGLLFFLALAALSFLLYVPLGTVEPLNNIFVSVGLGCALDVFFGLLTIIMFLFYWESTAMARGFTR